MAIKNGKIARALDVQWVINATKPFEIDPAIIPVVVTSKDYPTAEERRTRLNVKVPSKKHRAFIYDKITGRFLVGASSTYELVDKIRNGWKYTGPKKEGLRKQ